MNQQAYRRTRANHQRTAGVHIVGDIITTPQEVHDAKLSLDSQMVATNRQWEKVTNGNAQNNPDFSAVAAQDIFAWTSFFNTWNSFVLEESSVLTAASDMARVNDFTTQLAGWQKQLEKDTQHAPGGVETPVQPATPPSEGGGILGNAAKTVSGAEAGALSTLIKPITEIAVLGLAIYLGIEFLPPIVSTLKTRLA